MNSSGIWVQSPSSHNVRCHIKRNMPLMKMLRTTGPETDLWGALVCCTLFYWHFTLNFVIFWLKLLLKDFEEFKLNLYVLSLVISKEWFEVSRGFDGSINNLPTLFTFLKYFFNFQNLSKAYCVLIAHPKHSQWIVSIL